MYYCIEIIDFSLALCELLCMSLSLPLPLSTALYPDTNQQDPLFHKVMVGTPRDTFCLYIVILIEYCIKTEARDSWLLYLLWELV